MQQIIKQVDPTRQLFKTINFALMKFFDFFSHNSHFQSFSAYSWVIRVTNKGQKSSLLAKFLSWLYSHWALFSAVICDAIHLEKQKGPKKSCFD